MLFFSTRSPRSLLLLAALVVATAPVMAQDEGPARPRWEIGAFALGVSQQAYPGSDTQLSRGLALPFFVYRGEVLRADQGTAGLRALKTDRFELDIGFAGAFGSRADEVPARRGMPKLGTLVEFGPRVKWKLTAPGETWLGGRWRVDLPLRGVFDLSDGLTHRGTTLEPELTMERRLAGGFNTSVSLSAIVGDRRLNDTFYGVAPAFANAGRPTYAAKSGLIAWRLGAGFSKSLSPDWQLFGFARLESVQGAANVASPLVKQTTGATAGIGVSWTWLRSSQKASD